MRVVFLDFDGVLNAWKPVVSKVADDADPVVADLDWLDPVMCARVEAITQRGRASIVVSSTWRLSKKLPKLRVLLRARGISAPVVGVTPDIPNESRGSEISRWIAQSSNVGSLGSYVVLDDDDGAGVGHVDRFVQTSGSIGIRDHHVERALEILERPL